MIICKKCKQKRTHEGRGLCLNCGVSFRALRRRHGISLEDFIKMKKYKHYKSWKKRQ